MEAFGLASVASVVAGRIHRGGRHRRSRGRCSALGHAPDRDLRRQRPRRRGRAGPRRGRGPARPRGHLDRRLRQHVPGRAAPHVADDGRPAAAGDGPPGLRAAAGAHRRAAPRASAACSSRASSPARPPAPRRRPSAASALPRLVDRSRAGTFVGRRRAAQSPDRLDVGRPATDVSVRTCASPASPGDGREAHVRAITGQPDRFTADDSGSRTLDHSRPRASPRRDENPHRVGRAAATGRARVHDPDDLAVGVDARARPSRRTRLSPRARTRAAAACRAGRRAAR